MCGDCSDADSGIYVTVEHILQGSSESMFLERLDTPVCVTVEHVASEWSVLLNWPACVLSVDTHMSMLGLLFVQVMQ